MDRVAFMQKWEHEQFPPKSYQIGKFFHTPYSNHFGQRGLPPPKPQTGATKGRSKLALDHGQGVLNPCAIV